MVLNLRQLLSVYGMIWWFNHWWCSEYRQLFGEFFLEAQKAEPLVVEISCVVSVIYTLIFSPRGTYKSVFNKEKQQNITVISISEVIYINDNNYRIALTAVSIYFTILAAHSILAIFDKNDLELLYLYGRSFLG